MNKQRYTRDTPRISKNAKSISEIDFTRTYRILLDVAIAQLFSMTRVKIVSIYIKI